MSGPNSFLKDRNGSSAAEFALIALLFLGIVFAVTDMARALWVWNTAQKATQIGVRMAVVDNFAAQGLQTYNGVADAGGNGLSVPIAAISPNPVICTASGCNGYGPLDPSFTRIATRMQNIYGGIQPANVVIEYQHIGLGYAGNPIAPDIYPVVTVKLQNMTFTLVTPILTSFLTLSMPDFAASLTGESLGS